MIIDTVVLRGYINNFDEYQSVVSEMIKMDNYEEFESREILDDIMEVYAERETAVSSFYNKTLKALKDSIKLIDGKWVISQQDHLKAIGSGIYDECYFETYEELNTDISKCLRMYKNETDPYFDIYITKENKMSVQEIKEQIRIAESNGDKEKAKELQETLSSMSVNS